MFFEDILSKKHTIFKNVMFISEKKHTIFKNVMSILLF